MPSSTQSHRGRAAAHGDGARDALERAIVEGELAAGEPLREGPLAARLGTSRTRARDALQELAAIDLVRTDPDEGYRVTPFEPVRLAQLVQVAAALSGTAARLALPHLTPDDRAWLDQAEGHLFAFDVPVSGVHPYGPFVVDVFVLRSGNDVLQEQLRRLQPHVLRLVRQFGRGVTQAGMARRTGGTMAALRAGDAHLLGESVRVFFEDVGMELVRALEDSRVDRSRA
ncbi:GntR family transcriptional regulator [Cellulomonas sp. ICMP 17802]|uniref:GntR family transcriptional regulator n=1 Tax=Cellulomonas sp. ICMP 17802 TaxID=3239199 RepID=UPI00351BA16C